MEVVCYDSVLCLIIVFVWLIVLLCFFIILCVVYDFDKYVIYCGSLLVDLYLFCFGVCWIDIMAAVVCAYCIWLCDACCLLRDL